MSWSTDAIATVVSKRMRAYYCYLSSLLQPSIAKSTAGRKHHRANSAHLARFLAYSFPSVLRTLYYLYLLHLGSSHSSDDLMWAACVEHFLSSWRALLALAQCPPQVVALVHHMNSLRQNIQTQRQAPKY